ILKTLAAITRILAAYPGPKHHQAKGEEYAHATIHFGASRDTRVGIEGEILAASRTVAHCSARSRNPGPRTGDLFRCDADRRLCLYCERADFPCGRHGGNPPGGGHGPF